MEGFPLKRHVYLALLIFIILLVSGFSPLVFSSESDFSSDFDEELISNIEFYCYSNSSISQNEKSLLMLKHVRETEIFSLMNFDSDDLEEKQSYYQEIVDAEDKNTNVISLDPKDTPWPMKCYDNHHTGRSPYSTADNNGVELWRFKCGWIEGGPIINDDGTIYFGDYSGPFYALYPDGSLKWVFDNFGQGSSISANPALAEDGTIYVGSWDHYFYAINPDGSLKWKVEIGTTSSSPAIGTDGTIYTGTMNNKIFSINPDGTVKWKYLTGYSIIGGPAIGDDGTIYIGSGDTYFYALNPNGTLKWRFKTGHYIKGPPSIAEDGTVYFGSYDGYLYALYPNGTMRWQYKLRYGTETNPSIGPDGTIFVGDDKLYAINPDGNLKWTFNPGSDQDIFQSSPAISAEGIIYFGTNIGDVYGGDIVAVNPDGTLRWRHTIAEEWVDSSPCIGENGIVYIGSSFNMAKGYLYAFGPGDVNNPPDCPSIEGLTSGKSGESYSYVITGSDPDGDIISYFVDWGDSSDSGWQGPYSSGTSIELSHIWSEQGYYTVKAKVMDEYDSESSWSTLEVSMPRRKHVYFNLFDFMEQLREFFSFF